jgi:tRNA (cytidine/uridine-2'-O-)-methyltransferase
MNPGLSIILFQPQIPQNTGNIGRLCAITRSTLHLIHPLGFIIEDKHLRRSGMDYWHSLDLVEHASWDDFLKSPRKPSRIWLFTTKTKRSFWNAAYQPGDGLLFGNEGSGAPEWLHAWAGESQRVTIPHAETALRSLNLSTSVGIAAYEALRQWQ